MDKEREIRFLYPPIVVSAYFIWGWLGDTQGWQSLAAIASVLRNLGQVTGPVLGLLAGGSLLISIGFLLGTTTYLILRAVFWNQGTHEIPVSRNEREAIWNSVVISQPFSDSCDVHMAAVWLDFACCKNGVHEWVVRRWNAFNLSANIALGITICLIWGTCKWAARVTPSWWFCVGFIVIIAFTANAIIAWKEAMRMHKFTALKLTENTRQLSNARNESAASSAVTNPSPTPPLSD